MNWFTKAIQSALGSGPRERASAPRTRIGRDQFTKQRGFAGARTDRLTSDFLSFDEGPNAELESALPALRRRSHQNANDQDHAKRFLQLVETNVIGPDGILCDPQPLNRQGEVDKDAKAKISRAWQDFCRRGMCTVDGRLDMASSQRLAISSIARDGEGLARYVLGPSARNGFGFALQHLEAHHLDDSYSIVQSRGQPRVLMGVEVSQSFRPLGYYLLLQHPGELPQSAQARIRVPADRILHAFIVRRPNQVRGVPWMHTSTRRLRMLGGYEEAELVAARHAAEKLGVLVSPDGEFFDDDDDEGTDDAAVIDSQAGTFETVPEGYDFKPWDPQHPTAAFDAFVKANLRSLAAGLGVSYHSLSMDLSGANYSSLRQGHNEDRDLWRTIQNWFINQWLCPIYEAWLEQALFRGVLDLPAEGFERFKHATYKPRGWRHVDPDKASRAFERELALGVTTRTEYVRQTSNRDLRAVLEELKAEQLLADELGVPLGTPTPDNSMPTEDPDDAGTPKGNAPDA